MSLLVPANPGSLGQRAVKWQCVCNNDKTDAGTDKVCEADTLAEEKEGKDTVQSTSTKPLHGSKRYSS